MLKNLTAFLFAGALSAAAAPAFAQDLTPPVVAVTAPAHNSYLNSLAEITGTAFDNVMVSSVQVRLQRQSDGYYWDGSAFAATEAWLHATVLSTAPAAAWSYATVPAWLNGAAYEVNARAMDPSGNWSVPYSTAVFHYDVGLPVSAVTAPLDGAVVSSFPVINGTAWDNESFTAQVWVRIDRAPDNYYWNEALSQWTAAEVWNLAVDSVTWTYAGLAAWDLAAGTTYTAVSRAVDLAGNAELSILNAVSFVYAGPVVPSTAAYWSLDESFGSAAADSSGNGNDGTLLNGAGWAQGVSSGSLSLDGVNDYVHVPDSSLLTPQGALTVAFWVNREEGGAVVEYMVTKDDLGDRSWQIYLTTADIQYRIYDSTGNESVLMTADPLSVYGEWTHLAFVFDPSGWQRIYRNGTEVASSTHSFSGLNDNTAPLRLGAGYWTPLGYPYYFKGKLDEVGVYPKVLSPDDIAALYALHYSTPPVLSSAAFSGVGVSSLTVNWGSTFDAGTNYFVRLATQAASGPYVDMATTTAASYGFTGLTPDTTYYGFVSTDMASGYMASGEGLTLAAAPSSVAFTAVAYSSAALSWSGGSNPAYTVYELQVHTSSAFASFTSSGSLAGVSAPLGGLEQGTTYYARVRAVNSAGTATAYAYSGPAVTARLYAAGAPAGVAGVTLGVSSISWSWNSGTLSAADIFIAREGGVIVSTQPFGASGAYTQEGLTPNTSHTLSVTGSNANGETAAAVSPAVYTLAAPPAGLSAPFVSPSSAALSWGLNGNPAGVTAQLWRSPNDASYTNVYEGAALAYADAALEECTLYYYKARNINGAGLYTAFTAPVSFTTTASTPSAPGGLYAEALDGARITLTWEPSPSTSLVTQYRLYYDNASGTIDYGTPYTSFSSTVTAWTTPALTAGNTYKFAVRAVTRCGVEEANASAAYAQAVGVLSGVRAAIKAPQTGKRIKGNSVTVIADLTLGLPSQVKNVRFQYRLAGNIAWTDITAANINHPNPDTAAPYFVHWDADSMAAGTYELRALATDVFDAADPAPPIVTVVVDPVDFDVSESVLAGQVQKEQKIVNTVPSTVQAGDGSTALLSKVVIPAGAVSVTTAAVTLIPNPPARPAPPSGSGDLAIAVKINLSNGQSQLAGGNSAVITLSYKDDDGDGVVDGTTAEVGRLRIYAASDTGTSWTPLASTVDRTARTVSAPTTHFSFFSAFATTAAGLSSMKAYPNPWQAGAGGRFDAAAVTFTGLPNEARIKIFTILGELVRQIDVTAADAGTTTWDGRNSNGSKAASGVYLVRVESGGDDRTLKLAVER